MHIEKIVVKGFRSYHDGELVDISPRQNVIVGPNGSGKSNIVTALEFVLTRNHTKLRPQQKSSFLCSNQSAGRVFSGSVEVTLNNSERRLDVDGIHVPLKRVITENSDKYYINGKSTTVFEYLNIMENGGFSPNNSHFLVSQGFISEVAFGSHKDLLHILRRVSGAATFEEKKEQALKLITNSQADIQKFEKRIELARDQLKIQQFSPAQFEQYKQARKDCRYLECKLDLLDVGRLTQELEESENDKETAAAEHKRILEKANEVKNQHDEMEEELKRLEKLIAFHQQRYELSKETLTYLDGKLFNIENEIQEIESADSQESQNEEQQLKDELQKAKDELSGLKENEKRSLKKQAKENYSIEDQENFLANACILPENEDERETFIENIIQSLENRRQRQIVQQLESKLELLKTKMDNLHKEKEKAEKYSIKDKKKQISTVNCEIDEMKCDLKKIVFEMGKCHKEISVLERKVLEEHEMRLNLFTDNMAIKSKKSMKELLARIKSELNNALLDDVDKERLKSIVDGYYGQFVDLVQFDSVEAFYNPIESLLKSRIFYHIVESQKVALNILQELRKPQNSHLHGNFRFICLDQAVSQCEKPENGEPGVLPLSSYTKCRNQRHQRAIDLLCGKNFFCKDFNHCSQMTTKFLQCNFSDIHGNLASNTGVVTIMPSHKENFKTKLQLYYEWKTDARSLKTAKETLIQLEVDYKKKREEIQLKEQEKTKLEKEINDDSLSIPNLNRLFREVEEEFIKTKKEIITQNDRNSWYAKEIEIWKNSEDFADKVNEIKNNLPELLSKRNKHAMEFAKLSSEISDKLTEIFKLEEKLKSKEHRKQELLAKAFSKGEYENRKKKIEEEKKMYQEKMKEDVTGWNDAQADYDKKKPKRDRLHNRYDKLKNLAFEKEEEICSYNKQIEEKREKLAEYDVQDLEDRKNASSRISAHYKNLESNEDLTAAIHECNEELARISNGQLTDDNIRHFEELYTKLVELENLKDRSISNTNSLRDLIQTIEDKKKEIIIRTYNQVNKYMQEFFRELVPSGDVRLLFIKAPNQRVDINNNNESSNGGSQQDSSQGAYNVSTSSSQDPTPDVLSLRTISSGASSVPLTQKVTKTLPLGDELEGLQIIASFDNKHSYQDAKSLSHGQKTMISLAFVFALQKVDPTPFYIFDEVDRDLDSDYRASLANLIHRLSSEGGKQFIITTFRPELCEHSDKFFRVANHNRFSHVNETTKEDALDFIRTTPNTIGNRQSPRNPL